MGYFVLSIIVILAIMIAPTLFLRNRSKRLGNNMQKFMAENNFTPEYSYHHFIAIDSKTKRIILSTGRDDYSIHNMSDILNIKMENVRTKTMSAIQIAFTVNDLARPRIHVPFLNGADRDIWYDRVRIMWRM